MCLITSTACCCVSVQGLRPLKDSAFAVFEGESFRETLLTRQPLLNGMIYATRCRHFLSFVLFFSGVQRILGYRSGASSKNREKKDAFEGAFKLRKPSRGVVT